MTMLNSAAPLAAPLATTSFPGDPSSFGQTSFGQSSLASSGLTTPNRDATDGAAAIMPLQTIDLAKAQAAGREFEATFLSQMLSFMFESIKTDKEFGGGRGEDSFKTMLVSEYGKMIAKAGGIGVAAQVTRYILKTQEV
ncbi:MAG: rod-binding protein [Azospirillaceae bacterium]|nr:rod-binding protein [Azospirillaceae bacterium]